MQHRCPSLPSQNSEYRHCSFPSSIFSKHPSSCWYGLLWCLPISTHHIDPQSNVHWPLTWIYPRVLPSYQLFSSILSYPQCFQSISTQHNAPEKVLLFSVTWVLWFDTYQSNHGTILPDFEEQAWRSVFTDPTQSVLWVIWMNPVPISAYTLCGVHIIEVCLCGG